MFDRRVARHGIGCWGEGISQASMPTNVPSNLNQCAE
jgi:hypothetical protein